MCTAMLIPLHLPASRINSQKGFIRNRIRRGSGDEMTKVKILIAIVIAGSLASGCSTKPRQFAPALTAPADHSARLEQDVKICDQLVRQGRTSDFASAAATMATTGAATVGSGVAMVSTGMVGWTSSGAGAAAAGIAMPVIGLFAGLGVSRAIRGGNERKYKTRMEACLTELGYTTDGWQKIHKRGDPGFEAGRLAKFEAIEPVAGDSTPDIDQAVIMDKAGDEALPAGEVVFVPAADVPVSDLPQ